MTRPGNTLRRFTARVCSERTRRRLIDPAIADLQAEFATARRAGSSTRTARALVAGYFAVAKVLAIAVAGDLRAEASTWQPEERAGARRGVLVALGTTTLVTGVLVTNFVSATIPIPAAWMVYLVPSMLTLSLPLGALLGTAWTLHGGARTQKLAVGCVTAAALCSIVTFANIVWVVPDANQAFRQRAVAREQGRDSVGPIPRGLHELSLPALRARIEQEFQQGQPHRARVAEVVYYQRFAMAGAMLPMHGVVVALAFRRPRGRGRLTAAALATFGLYYALLAGSRSISEALAVAPIVTVWAGPMLIAGLALLLTSLRPRARA